MSEVAQGYDRAEHAVKQAQGEIPMLLERIDVEISELEMTLHAHIDRLNPVLGFDDDKPIQGVDPAPSYQSALANTLDGYVNWIKRLRGLLRDTENRVQL